MSIIISHISRRNAYNPPFVSLIPFVQSHIPETENRKEKKKCSPCSTSMVLWVFLFAFQGSLTISLFLKSTTNRLEKSSFFLLSSLSFSLSLSSCTWSRSDFVPIPYGEMSFYFVNCVGWQIMIAEGRP